MAEGTVERVAVVTGGTGALGHAVVSALLAEAVAVHVPWVVEAEAERTRSAFGDAERLLLAHADVTDPASVDAYFESVIAQSGRLDALLNLAGGFTMAPLAKTEPSAWDHMMKLNATSAFLCCRAAAPLMKPVGGGRIVNVAALPAVDRGTAGMAAYAASKAALLNLTYSLSKELREDWITVNAVAPEILDTAANRKAMPNADYGKWVKTEDAARVIAFLASEGARAVTGSVLTLAVG
jgi:NAD(P)-dependent dehydrogenase (short-subunit alcohol dehydrogenase family)